jgi:hypothetical protein
VKAELELYGQDVVHVETTGQEFKGFDIVLMKEKQFLEKLQDKPLIKVSEPLVAGDYFSISMYMKFVHSELGPRNIEEIIVYKVTHGKITHLKCYA